MLSPAKLLFGQKMNTDLPQSDHCLAPQWTYLDKFRKVDKEYKDKQQSQYNRSHRVRLLSVLPAGSQVLYMRQLSVLVKFYSDNSGLKRHALNVECG